MLAPGAASRKRPRAASHQPQGSARKKSAVGSLGLPGVSNLGDPNNANRRGASINVSFDQQYGFPTSAFIDYVKNAIDDELSIRTSGFDLIPAPES